MRYFLFIAVFIGLVLQNCSQYLVVLEYKINQTFIANVLCENRDKPVKAGKEFNSRVGYQVRRGDGSVEKTGTLTCDSLYVTFPVVKAVDNRTALVAYAKRAGEKREVCYRWINL